MGYGHDMEKLREPLCEIAQCGLPCALEAMGDAARVEMEEPRFDWDVIPLAYAMDTRDMPVAWDELEHGAAVNVGNPHIVFFVPEADAVALDELGPRIETDPLFPERVNVNVASLDGDNQLQLRVWERGAGLTLACGSGACAAIVAASRRGLVDRRAEVVVDGGTLTMEWLRDGHVLMTGGIAVAFKGELDASLLA